MIDKYWIIVETTDSDCGHRWIAYPATKETLQGTIEIGKIFDKPIVICEEKETF